MPEIRPVLAVNDKPAGRDGLIDQLDDGPPTFEGISGVMDTSCVNVKEAAEYAMSGRASASATVMLMTKVSLPAELVAVTV